MHNDSIINTFLDFCYQDFSLSSNDHTSGLTFHYQHDAVAEIMAMVNVCHQQCF